MKVCPKCGKVAAFNSYFNAYICNYCGWEERKNRMDILRSINKEECCMRSMIYRKHRIDQLVLCFDSLIPEEVKKLLDCIWDDSMNDILNDYIEVEYSYNVNKINDRWVHDSVIFIQTPEVVGMTKDEIDAELEKDRKILERIRDILLKKSGLVEEED